MGRNFKEIKDRQVISFLVEDRFRIWRHLIFLAAFLLLIYNSSFPQRFSGIYAHYCLLALFSLFVLMFYVNIYFLVPKFFFKGRYLAYGILVLLLVFTGLSAIGDVIRWMEPYRVDNMDMPVHSNSRYEGTIISVPMIMVTTMIKLLQKSLRDNQRIAELHRLTLQMELNELRNQINPHFLFNNLNSIKALIRINPEQARETILKLSDFLRYQLYENNDEKTTLSSEMTFLSNFLDLERIRRDDFSVHIQCDAGTPLERILIPPNLFTTFVENAVKHSVMPAGTPSFIDVLLTVKDDSLEFCCRNSKSQLPEASPTKSGGLGLANIKRRLELLYPNQHRLHIETTPDTYSVNLTLPL